MNDAPLVTSNREALVRALVEARMREHFGSSLVTLDLGQPDVMANYRLGDYRAEAERTADALLASVVRASDTLADDEALVGHLSYEVMNEEADLADWEPGKEAWDDLALDIRQMLRLLPTSLAAALTEPH